VDARSVEALQSPPEAAACALVLQHGDVSEIAPDATPSVIVIVSRRLLRSNDEGFNAHTGHIGCPHTGLNPPQDK
jgi:hypothetical protein